MSRTRQALNGFDAATAKLNEQSAALTQAGQDFQANPEDPTTHQRFTKLSIPEGYPDVHKAAVAFQEALHGTSKAGHTRGWSGGEQELEALQIAAQTHGIDPGLFVTPDGAGSKREHILQLTRVYNGKFLPGDGRSQMWDPQSHSFQTGEDAQSFANMVNHYYPDMMPEVNQGQIQGQVVGDDGQPIPTPEPTWSVEFSHEDLGEPYPPGTAAHASQVAMQRSSQMPHQHHVVVDPASGEHQVTLEPAPGQQVVQSFQGGQPVSAAPPEGEEQPPEGEQPPEEAPPQEPAPGGEASVADMAAAQGAAPAGEGLDAIDRLLSEWNFVRPLAERRRSGGSAVIEPEIEGPRGLEDLTTDQHRQLLKHFETHKTWNHPHVKGILGIGQEDRIPGFLKKHKTHQQFARAVGMRPRMMDDEEFEMGDALSEMKALFQASLKRTPTLMMEAIPVDSNRGVTARGNSHFDHYASPETREKVLEARMKEIEAFAQSRSIPTSNIFAAVEASMRTGKVPDLGQYGLAGDDAVATKQFIISNILNIQGLEAVDYKGDPVDEEQIGKEAAEAGISEGEAERRAALDRLAQHVGRMMGRDPGHREVQQVVQNYVKKLAGIHGEEPASGRTYTKGRGLLRADVEFTDKEIERAIVETHGAYGKAMVGIGPYTAEPTKGTKKRKQRYPMAEASTKAGGYPFAEKEKHYRKHTDAQLDYAHKDALEAASAMKDHDPVAHGWYMDDAATISQERRRRQQKGRRKQISDIEFDQASYMAEEGGPYRTGGAPERAPLSPSRSLPGFNGPIDARNFMKQPLLPKEICSKLRAELGDRVDGMPRWELFDIARERGLLGTEEGMSPTGDDISEMGPVLGAIGRGVAAAAKNPAVRKAAVAGATELARRLMRPKTPQPPQQQPAEDIQYESVRRDIGTGPSPERGGMGGPRRKWKEPGMGGPPHRGGHPVGSKAYWSKEPEVEGEPEERLWRSTSRPTGRSMRPGGPEKPGYDVTKGRRLGLRGMSYGREPLGPTYTTQSRWPMEPGPVERARKEAKKEIEAAKAERGEEPRKRVSAAQAAALTSALRKGVVPKKSKPRPEGAPARSLETHQESPPRKSPRQRKAALHQGMLDLVRKTDQYQGRNYLLRSEKEALAGLHHRIERGFEDMHPSEQRKLVKKLGNHPVGRRLATKMMARKASLSDDVEWQGDLVEHDFEVCAKKKGGKFVSYVQPHQAIYEFPTEEKAHEFAALYTSYTTATPTVKGKRVSIDEPMLGESGQVAPAVPGMDPRVHTSGPTTPPLTKEEKKAKSEDTRTESDKILGIESGDPRAESWPKMSDEMKRLMNLEDCRVFGNPRGFTMPEPEAVEEATFGCTNVGAFLGAGGLMPGGALVSRDDMIPSYDASIDLKKDAEEAAKKKADVDAKKRKERLAALLRDIGITQHED
jgi:hypothetical protein